MNLDEIFAISLVFLFISHGLNGYQEDLRAQVKRARVYNNTIRDCRAEGFGRNICVSGSDGNLSQDGNLFNSYDLVTGASSDADSRPLILTPYIKARKFQEGIKAAKIAISKANIESYSGFFEVNERRKSYMFFWYFPPLSEEYVGKQDTPVILWIQGEMGKSGMFAAFRENGPIRLESNEKMVFNEWSWAQRAHLVYFDSPVGVGYSFTKSGIYPTTQDEVATDMYIALRQYLRLFRLTKNPFFISGQAYAGKTVSALGAVIHKRKTAFPINFQGVAIGNGFVDPPNMLEYGKFLYQLGFIDEETRNELHFVRNKIHNFLKKNMEKEALDLYTEYIQHNLSNNSPFLDRETALVSKLNFMQVRKGLNEEELLAKLLNTNSIQDALHATGIHFDVNNADVLTAIWTEVLKSQVHNLKLLMNNYRVLLYHGQMSIKNAYPLVLEYLRKIRWRDRRKYHRAERVQWRVNQELAGYFKTGGSFTELLMRNAGCHVSADQPKWAQHMINKFIFAEDLNSE